MAIFIVQREYHQTLTRNPSNKRKLVKLNKLVIPRSFFEITKALPIH